MRAILSAELAALCDLSAAMVAADETTLVGSLERALADADPERVEETILQAYLFLGFPTALEAMKRWRDLVGPAAAGSGSTVAEPQGSEPEGAEPDGGGTDRTGTDGAGTPDTWRARGEEVCRRVYGANYEKLRANVEAMHRDLDRWMVAEGYGKVLGRPGLDLSARELCIVAQLTAAAREVQLHSHLRGALNTGATSGEVEAALRIGLQHVEQPEWARRVEQLWWTVRERVGRSRHAADS